MRRPLAVISGLSLAVASCGGSDAGNDATPSATTVETAAPSTDAPEPTTGPVDTDPPATDPPATDPAVTDPPATDPPEPELPAIDTIGFGEYGVGVQTITITDVSRDRPLTVDVWFPLAEGATGDPHRYAFITGDYYESPDAISVDAASISPDGPFPLVLWSHGSGGVRYQSSFYTEAIASHGYIVVAPDHTGNTAVDRIAAGAASDAAEPATTDGEAAEGSENADSAAIEEPAPEEEVDPEAAAARSLIALNRVQDMSFVLDEMLNPESTETVGFVASVDPESIAISGHSFGGFTTYALVSGYDNDLGSVEPDTRIDAIIPLAPAVGDGGPNSLLTDERLESISVPSLVMVGTNDQTTPADPNVTRAFELTQSSPSYRVDFVDAQHQSFTDICEYRDFIPELPDATPIVVQVIEELAVEGCSTGDMPIGRVHELATTFAISFLDSVFDETPMITADTFAIPDDIVVTTK